MSIKIAKKLWQISKKTKTHNLDKKHSHIVDSAKNFEFDKFLNSYRNWEKQNDQEAPFQFNFYSFKSFGYFNYLRYFLGILKGNLLYGFNQRNYFFDDIKIIKLLNGFDILEKCPVHKSPGNNIAYFLNKNISANVRWLRYIYFATVIRNEDVISNANQTILDIGSYYGGFQYVIKKIFPNSKHILVDFPHQLARSAIFLGKSFPEAKIHGIYDKHSLEKYFNNNYINHDFVLLSTEYYNDFSERYTSLNYKLDLLTNFYSFGEISKNNFDSYFNSKILKNSNKLYFCNRYDSSPFFEPTYSEKYSLLNYLLKEFKVILNRQSGIHNYVAPVRTLFGEKRQRPLSSSYFDLIQQREL
ncbi:MAG: hypothetical protein CMC50_00310 [Flavobacteriaceae bacterium]|nr:hypothetical protein [Flavobacteriaceae bacterium]|tara:strand:+ start:3198 stop:4268 length:1071 start_codon:yes stop_codon:yes gene_type:complete